MADLGANPWLVLIHQLPPKPATLRVKVWRRLQALGAVPIKNSVYALPNNPSSREDFEWLLREIQQEGGEASLCEARLVDGLTDDEVRMSFQTVREHDYRELATEVRAFARDSLPRRGKSPSPEQRARIAAGLARFRKRFAEIAEIDFYAAPGREALEGLLADLEMRIGPASAARHGPGPLRRTEDVAGRVWVTRTGVHIDRIASAWLIRRFIDPRATFKFVTARGYEPAADELRFDMFDAEFTHRGELCTFEVLLHDFDLRDAALAAIAEVIHDVDLKVETFGRPETPGIEHLVAGIAWSQSDDDARIAQGSSIFEALYTFFNRRNR